MSAREQLEAFFRRVERDGKAAVRAASPDELHEARLQASAEIDRIFVFKGAKANPSQEMEWPRVGVENVRPDEVPQLVIDMTLWLGGAYLAGYRIGPPDKFPHAKDIVSCLFWLLDPLIEADDSVRRARASH